MVSGTYIRTWERPQRSIDKTDSWVYTLGDILHSPNHYVSAQHKAHLFRTLAIGIPGKSRTSFPQADNEYNIF